MTATWTQTDIDAVDPDDDGVRRFPADCAILGRWRYYYRLSETRSDSRMIWGAADPRTGLTQQFATRLSAREWCRG